MMIKQKLAFTIKYNFCTVCHRYRQLGKRRNVDVGLSYCLDNFNPNKRDLSDRP